MSRSNPAFQSFVVKIWLEETVGEAGRATWKGRVTRIPSDEVRHVRDLHEITDFISEHLERAGVRPPLCQRMRRLLSWRR